MALGAAAVLALLAACAARPPEEEALRARIAAMAAALAEGRAEDFLDALAEDFVGPEPDFDRRRAGLMLRLHLARHRRLGVELGPLAVERHGERAGVRFLAVLRAGEGVVPEELGVWRVETGWRRERAGWVLVSARWERPLGDP
ncbi:MAG: hypothetical protein RML12_07655 [Xanthomonadales bacterium]|nr:hypothetical protein [Xanthomonadales bacterium]